MKINLSLKQLARSLGAMALVCAASIAGAAPFLGINEVPFNSFAFAQNILYVNGQANTNYSAVKGRVDFPFQTLTAAKNAAKSGDTIIVMPGTYAENDLLKNGVNWFFMPGSVVSYTSSIPASWKASGTDNTTIQYGIFDDRSSGAVTSTIAGSGVFQVTSKGFSGLLGTIVVTNASTTLTVDCKDIYFSIFLANGAQGRSAIYVSNATKVSVNCHKIYGNSGATHLDTGFTFSGDPGDETFATDNGSGVYWELGSLIIKCDTIEKTSLYSVWGNQPDNNAIAADLYVKAEMIEGHYYMDSGLTSGSYNWKTWLDVKELRDAPTLFDFGKHYLSVQKLDCSSQTVVVLGACRFWLTAQKISNDNASGGWVKLSSSATGTPIVYLNCQQFEDVSASFANAGIEMNAGELHVNGGFLKTAAGNTKPAFLHAGGSSRITACTIDTTAQNNAGSIPIKVAASGCVIDKCVLIAPALADSVNATSAQTVTAYGVKTNKAKNANVTVNVDALTPDTNVQ